MMIDNDDFRAMLLWHRAVEIFGVYRQEEQRLWMGATEKLRQLGVSNWWGAFRYREGRFGFQVGGSTYTLYWDSDTRNEAVREFAAAVEQAAK